MRKLIAAMKVSLDGKVTNADWVQAWSDDYSLMPEIDSCVLGQACTRGTNHTGPRSRPNRRSLEALGPTRPPSTIDH
jgi:hypothetical protein